MVGDIVGHYRVDGKLGEGGMGTVWKAEDLQLKRAVALKFLHASEDLTKLLLEAQTVGALNHPNICTVHEVNLEHGFLAMELVEGRSLKDVIGGRPIRVSEAIGIAIQAAEGLAAAHAKGIIHRDIKPANLILSDAGLVKIMDFGLARAPGLAAATVPGAAAGTPGYMAPEQLQGGQTDRRTDVWAFGALLHEMLTGRRPGGQRETLPEGLGRIVRKALAPEPAERYQHIDDLLVDLRHAATRVPGRIGRRTRLLAVAGVTLSAAIAAAVLLLVRTGRQPAPLQWQKLTSFTDSATSPALSADGRMVTFLRGPETFVTGGQVYVKVLPDGDPVRLTNDSLPKMSPVFSPDGSRIAYTVPWDTWVVPVLSGEPKPMRKNASGLIWTDPQHVLFTEVKAGWHMALVHSKEAGADARDVYLPPDTEYGMAHRSYLSPDRQQVLLVEMDRTGWLPCRMAPFAGGSHGRQVGPAPGRCTDAAWSPDGRWMYFSVDTGGGFHLWRQRTDSGQPEQLTFGPTEEEGIAVAPDGRSLITSAGTRQSAVYVHDAGGDRQLTSEGYAVEPAFAADGKKLYYLRSSARVAKRQLWVADLATGRSEGLLPGVAMTYYAVSMDDKLVVYWTAETGIRLAALDRGFPPRQLASGSGRYLRFAASGDVFFGENDGQASYLYRMKQDGSERRRVLADPIVELLALSPDEQWVLVTQRVTGSVTLRAYPLGGGPPVTVCGRCRASWAADGKSMWFVMAGALMGTAPATIVVPLRGGAMLPPLPPVGIRSRDDLKALPGARLIADEMAVPGPDQRTYAFSRVTAQRNLYRIPLP